MSEKIKPFTRLSQDDLTEEALLELFAQADHNTGITLGNIQDQITSTTLMLSAAIKQLEEDHTLNKNQLGSNAAGTTIPIEYTGTIFNVAIDRCKEKIAICSLYLEQLEIRAAEANKQIGGESTVNNLKAVESVIGVINTVACGAPILKVSLDEIAMSQTLIESATVIFNDFFSVLIQAEADIVQILGEVHFLKEKSEEEYSAQLDNIYFELISGLKSVVHMRQSIIPDEPLEGLTSPTEDPYSYATDVLAQSIQTTLSRVGESKAAIDHVAMQVKFLKPLLKDDNRQLNAEQQKMGLNVIQYTVKNLPLVYSNLNKITDSQTHIQFVSEILSKGVTVLSDIQSRLFQLNHGLQSEL